MATYGFLPFDLSAGTPLFGEPVLAEGLFSADISTDSPSLNQPSLNQLVPLESADAAAAAPPVTAPSIGQTNVLTAQSIRVNWPFFRERPTLADKIPVTSTDVAAAASSVSEPTATIRRDLTGVDVAAGTPTPDAPALSRGFLISALPTISTLRPSTSLATLSHAHVLSPMDVSATAPLLDIPGQVATHAPTVAGAAAIDVDVVLLSGDEQSGTDAVSTSGDEQYSTDAILLSGDEQAGATTNGGVAAGVPTVDTPTLAEREDYAEPSDAATAAPSVDNPTLGQLHYLAGNDIASANPATDTASTTTGPGIVVLIALGNDILEPDRPFYDGDQEVLGYDSVELEGDLSGRLIYEGDQSVATLRTALPTAVVVSDMPPVEAGQPTTSLPELGPLRLTTEDVTSVPTVSEPRLQQINPFFTSETIIYVPPDDPDPVPAEDITETVRVPAEVRTVPVPSDSRTIRVPARRVTSQTRRE